MPKKQSSVRHKGYHRPGDLGAYLAPNGSWGLFEYIAPYVVGFGDVTFSVNAGDGYLFPSGARTCELDELIGKPFRSVRELMDAMLSIDPKVAERQAAFPPLKTWEECKRAFGSAVSP